MSITRSFGRLLGIVLFTLVETVALGAWLALVLDGSMQSQTAAIGLGILFVGLLVEASLTGVVVNGFRSRFPLGAITFFSVTETVIWAVWLLVAERLGGLVGVTAAGVLLFVLMIPQHTIEDNILRNEGLFSQIFNLGTAGFSLIEAVAATVWLALVFQSEMLLGRLGLVTPNLSGITEVVPVVDVGSAALVGLAALAILLFVEHVVGVRFARRRQVADSPRQQAAESSTA